MKNNFERNLERLNAAQREAVETMDGPVMVLAGPGTGKTQLLAMRVANILRRTDMSPGNILCLTFTDAASASMTERMSELFGPEAYKVAVHTFHSFAAWATSAYPEYFYRGAEFKPADEITRLEILNAILRELPSENPLSGRFNEMATGLKDVGRAISDVKRGDALTSDELRKLMDENLKFIDFAEPIFAEVYREKISKNTLEKARAGYAKLMKYPDEKSTLARAVINDFADAINAAETSGKTNALTSFKNQCFTAKLGRMNDRKKSEKTRALADVLEKYDAELAARKMYDFDDMIVRMVAAIEGDGDFAAELRERFQYVLVDEFQDTNAAQMRILNALMNEPDSNIMTVGDDDQAIYSFQGANVNNLVDFRAKYPNAKIIQLYENYRSNSPILKLAEATISGAETRIKKGYFETIKSLFAARDRNRGEEREGEPVYLETLNYASELAVVSEDIAARLAADPTADIAVISRRHEDLMNLIPYLNREKIFNIEYEKNTDALASRPIRALGLLARVIVYLGRGAHAWVDEMLPELLAHAAWGIPAVEIWRLSLAVGYDGHWLEHMVESKNDGLRELAEWLLGEAKSTQDKPLETALNEIFEKAYKNFYFAPEKLMGNPDRYLDFLNDLIVVREELRAAESENPGLKDFVDYLDLHAKYSAKVPTVRRYGDAAKVKLITAHGAKGLEFDSVYMINAVKSNWLKTKADGFFPSNLRLSIPGSIDENLRLIYVAITRAKNRLVITSAKKVGKKGDDLTILPILGPIKVAEKSPRSSDVENMELLWDAKFKTVTPELKTLLAPKLAHYELSATAVNAFTDLEYHGPETFLLDQILRFPHPSSANVNYGTAVHEALKFAHNYYNKNGALPPIAEVKNVFEETLRSFHILAADEQYYLSKGGVALGAYLEKTPFNSHERPEQVFKAQLGDIRLTGKLDLAEFDEKNRTVRIVDYKTGAGFEKFDSAGKMKTHNYKQQLMFYRLLVENSTNFPGYHFAGAELHFVEPDEADEIKTLSLNASAAEMNEFKKLLEVIWRDIMDLDFPDASGYERKLKGTLAFERYLLSN